MLHFLDIFVSSKSVLLDLNRTMHYGVKLELNVYVIKKYHFSVRLLDQFNTGTMYDHLMF